MLARVSSTAPSGELQGLLTVGQDPVLSEGRDASAPLVILLHGHGGNEHDMAPLLHHLPESWAAVSVRAPLPHGSGFTWFGVADDAPEAWARDVSPIADALLDRIGHVTGGRPVAVAGFSQGGAVALQMIRRDPELVRAVVTLAGFLPSGTEAHDSRLRALRPPVFWGRGSDDDVITQPDIDRMNAFLPDHTSLTVSEYPGLGHWMSAPQLQDAAGFLVQRLQRDG